MKVKTPSVFAMFALLLRQAGFRKTWDTRSGGQRMTEWKREHQDGRTLEVQIWADGLHRVSHSWVGCSDTVPTSFKTAGEMYLAIKVEMLRCDGKYRDPMNHHVPSARAFLKSKQAKK